MPIPVALIIALPFVVGAVWSAWSAYVRYERYRAATSDAIRLDAALFQIFLHDEIDRDLRRLRLPTAPQPSALPLIELSIGASGLSQMRGERDGKRGYAKAALRRGNDVHDVRVRYQGRKHWHTLGVQKSMKVRVEAGGLVDGVRVFNLVNEVSPFGLEEQIIGDLAREQGLLTPEVHPVRLRIDNADLGVYQFIAQPDEGLLRRANRMPGDMYSGRFAVKCTPRADLPGHPCGWKKIAWPDEAGRATFGPLAQLMAAVYGGSHAAFADYARRELDLDRFALFNALDVVFAGEQHDFQSTQKLYYDPYRGRFEPVAIDYRAFNHEPAVNLVHDALLLRLESIPDYVWRRDREVYRLLTGDAAPQGIQARFDAAFAKLLPELSADPYWDAYKLLPATSKFHRQMVRPMSGGRWIAAAQVELQQYARRKRFLIDRFERPTLSITGTRETGRGVVEVLVRGHGAYSLLRLTAVGSTDAQANAPVSVWADVDRDGQRSAGDERVATGAMNAPLPLLSRGALVSGVAWGAPDGQTYLGRGPLTTRAEARTYRYFVEPPAQEILLEFEDRVTSAMSMRRVSLADEPRPPRQGDKLPDATRVPALAAGEVSPHPWSFAADPPPEVVSLGPGLVETSTTWRFGPHQTVVIAPGTDLRLASGASLIIEGRLDARGRLNAQIVIGPTGDSFGGVVLFGPATRGSRFEHVRIIGATRPNDTRVAATGALSIFDTSDVRLRNVRFTKISGAGDVLHATYVAGLDLGEVTIVDAPTDAVDLEHTTATIRGLRVLGAGDECVDTREARLTLSESLLVGCTGSALSAGEDSHVTMHGTVVARAKVGVLAKNASEVRISRSIIYDTEEALRTNRRDVHYDAPSAIDAEDVFVVATDDPIKRAKRTRIDARGLRGTFPERGRLEAIETSVLGIDAWSEIDARLDVLIGGGP